nr:H/ACA ribonucleoprotein complex non-core subunit NAF1 [Ciona intestinalis]|eukprot:XP_002127401.1 H/ACA ribonucleoprotein complex non-core subunit NAF1 [Ciona intestinalis]
MDSILRNYDSESSIPGDEETMPYFDDDSNIKQNSIGAKIEDSVEHYEIKVNSDKTETEKSVTSVITSSRHIGSEEENLTEVSSDIKEIKDVNANKVCEHLVQNGNLDSGNNEKKENKEKQEGHLHSDVVVHDVLNPNHSHDHENHDSVNMNHEQDVHETKIHDAVMVDQSISELGKPIIVEEIKESNESGDTFVTSMMEAVESIETSDDDDSDESSESSSSDSDTSSDETTSDESDIVIDPPIQRVEQVVETETKNPFGNLLLEGYPTIEEIEAIPPDNIELELIGNISNIIDNHVVIIKAIMGKPALNLDSVLFLEDKSIVGKIYETFGPVPSPYYVVCFKETKTPSELSVDQKIYFAPNIKDYTTFVLTAQLVKTKGSDASWKDDAEPPDQCIDFSDDEEERKFKKNRKEARSGTTTATHAPNKGRGRNHNTNQCVNRATRFATPTNQLHGTDVSWMMSHNQGNPQQGPMHNPPPPPFYQQNQMMGSPRMWNHPPRPMWPRFTHQPYGGYPHPPSPMNPPMDITMLFRPPPPPPDS